MKKISFPFVHDDQIELPIVPLVLPGGERVLALVDSGSEATLVDKPLVKTREELKKRLAARKAVTLQGFTEDKGLVVAETTMTVSSPSDEVETLEVKAFVNDLSRIVGMLTQGRDIPESLAVVIGSDAIRAMRGRIDYRKKGLVLYKAKKQ